MSAAPTETAAQEPFNRKTVFWGIFASLLAAAGFFLLSTYAPDFRLGREGATPLSKSGVGFAGLAKLLTLAGDPPGMARSTDDIADDNLLIVTISPDSNRAALDDIIEIRADLPTLFVLPKWQTMPLPLHQGWEIQNGRLPSSVVNDWLGRILKDAEIGVREPAVRKLDVEGRLFVAPAPQHLQWTPSTDALISAGGDKAVLIEVPERPFYVLTDPDLINNSALKDLDRAAAAVALVDMLRVEDEQVMFDLTLHGAGGTHDLGKLLVEPPFLALTLTVLVAAAMAFLHGLARFGSPQADVRAIPFGKRALVDTTATLLGRAGRLGQLGDRYAVLMRARAGALLGAPPALQGEGLDHWLDSRDKGEPDGFTSRLRMADQAKNQSEMQLAAWRLHDWIARRLSERR